LLLSSSGIQNILIWWYKFTTANATTTTFTGFFSIKWLVSRSADRLRYINIILVSYFRHFILGKLVLSVITRLRAGGRACFYGYRCGYDVSTVVTRVSVSWISELSEVYWSNQLFLDSGKGVRRAWRLKKNPSCRNRLRNVYESVVVL